MASMTTQSATSTSQMVLRNVLADSKSPYLLQHKDNPVAWQEFTPETIALAREMDRPIFLSSGYSACHWCHVFAHESFEDPNIAKLLNDNFISIKIDREERPDVDRMYMTYLQSVQGSGGWPLSVFMTPRLEPFFAGTYFPKGRFSVLLGRIKELWEEDREHCEEMGKSVIESLQGIGGPKTRTSPSLAHIISTKPAQKVLLHLQQTHDPRYGGFSPAGARSKGPKFPSVSLTLEPLARIAAARRSSSTKGIGELEISRLNDGGREKEEARTMAVAMLRAIWEGGIRDWVGGGVARYSVDERWRVPHFEKMLYDQAQLVSAALDFGLICDPDHFNDSLRASAAKDRKRCLDLAADILEYCVRDLLSPEGGFWGAEDADSTTEMGGKKAEGAFYVWTEVEMDQVLGTEATLLKAFFGVKPGGNVDIIHDSHGELRGKNILYQTQPADTLARQFGITDMDVTTRVQEGCKLLKIRRDTTRERPGLDDKILSGWNGLMVWTPVLLTALSKAAVILPTAQYPIAEKCLHIAHGVADFIHDKMWDEDTKTLTRSYRQGKGPAAQTDDYAFLIQGLLDLYTSTGEERHALFAVALQENQDRLFSDPSGGYFASSPDPNVLVRMRDTQDGAEPSSVTVSARNLYRLSMIASDAFEDLEEKGEGCYLSLGEDLETIPRAWGLGVAGLLDLETGYREFVVTGPESDTKTQDILRIINSTYIPGKVVLHLDPKKPPTRLAGKNSTLKALIDGTSDEVAVMVSLRICEGAVCGLPIYDIEEARKAICA